MRFAPSPTGLLHIGGLRTALYNYLVARQSGGAFVLRIEDTDRSRFVPEAEAYIRESLQWVGIEPDESPEDPAEHGPYRQSERSARYSEIASRLVSAGHAYLAFDTADEIAALRESGDTPGSVRYDSSTRMRMRNSLSLPPEEVQRLVAADSPHVVRLKVPDDREVVVDDIVRGQISFAADQLDDQILVKSDGYPTYHLANVVDDHDMQISHVIRGEEWLPSTPKHVLLYEMLDWSVPAMAHLPLILSPTGGKLSKRSADKHGIPVFVLDYRDSGFEPEAVLNYLALLGWHPDSDRERFSLDELVRAFSLRRVGSAGVQFDIEKLTWFNEQVLRELSSQRLAEKLAPHIEAAGWTCDRDEMETIVELLRDRISLARDVTSYPEFFRDPEDYDEKAVRKRWKDDSGDLLLNLLERLVAGESWDAPQLESAFESFLAENDIGKGRIMPVMRIALSGRASGPDLFPTLAVLGRETTARRFRSAADQLGAEDASS